MFVSVIVNVPASKVDREFEYAVPEHLVPFIQVGERIKIPFGETNRLIHGFIIDVHEQSIYQGPLKEIEEIPDLEPVINEEQMKLANYLKNNTFSPLVRILNAMIPEALKMKTSAYLQIYNINEIDAELVEALEGETSVLLSKKLLKYASKIKNAISKKQAEITYEANDKNKRIYKNVFVLKSYNLEQKILEIENPNIREIIVNLEPDVSYEKNELLGFGISEYYLTKLIKNKVFYKNKILKSRILERSYDIDDSYYKDHVKKESVKFHQSYQKFLQNKKDILWIPTDDIEIVQGISLVINDNIKQGKTTLIMVPDILSSYKFADLIKKFLGLPVLCLNSSLYSGEGLDSYYSICHDEYSIIVTTPVGVLWPYHHLGTIFVLDEESDNYLNDQSPRYDVRDVLKFRASYHNASIVYASFTPDLDYYHQAIKNEIEIIDNIGYLLKQKTTTKESVQVIDMGKELQTGNISPISESLDKAILDNLSKKQPILLILNNKGYSDFVLCRKCGHVEKCERCDISYRYHDKKHQLICPACGKTKEYHQTCSVCGSNTVKFMGLGAEKLQEYLINHYDNVKVTIINQPEYTRFKEQVYQIENGEIDIIIATDTYSRGLSITKIGLVGIMALDLILKAPGYKANQKAYAMLSHAKRNLTRSPFQQTMIIQTYNPDHFVLKSFVTSDYQSYFRLEMSYRLLLFAPPYYEVNRILVKGKYDEIFKNGYEIGKFIRKNSDVMIIGPTYNYTERAAQLIIKHQNKNINEIYQKIYEMYQEQDITLIIDKYPKSIL